MRALRTFVAASILFYLVGCTESPRSGRDTFSQAAAQSPRDAQGRCDSLVLAAPASPVHFGSLVRSQATPVTSEVSTLLNGDYDPGTGDTWILDRARPAIVVVDATGKEIQQWGRKGSGPGDFFVMPLVRPGHDVALLGNTVLAVDMYRLSLFTREGRFREMRTLAANPMALLPGVSIRALSDSTALLGVAQSRLTTDTAIGARATVRFQLIHSTGSKLTIDTLPYFLKNKEWYSGGYNRSRVPFYSKFGFEMGETWTASRGGLLAVSFAAFGTCRVDPVTGVVRSAIRVDAPRRATTEAERLAVHTALPGIDETNPDGTNWGQELDDHWPTVTPWYLHVVAGDGMIAAARSGSPSEEDVDLFDGERYRGTARTPLWWLRTVVTISGDSLLRVERDTTTDAVSMVWYHYRG